MPGNSPDARMRRCSRLAASCAPSTVNPTATRWRRWIGPAPFAMNAAVALVMKIGHDARVAHSDDEQLVGEALDRQPSLLVDRARPARFVDDDEPDGLRLHGESGEERVVGGDDDVRCADVAAVRLLEARLEERASALRHRRSGRKRSEEGKCLTSIFSTSVFRTPFFGLIT
jgi:hypothetical protein